MTSVLGKYGVTHQLPGSFRGDVFRGTRDSKSVRIEGWPVDSLEDFPGVATGAHSMVAPPKAALLAPVMGEAACR